MRKLAFILALLCCLSVGTDRMADRACNCAPARSTELLDSAPGVHAHPAHLDRTPVHSSSVLSAGSASADRWRCERACNSDLNLPRLAPVAGPESVTPPQLRGARPVSGRHSQQQQLSAADRCADRMKATCSFLLDFHSAVPHGADFYVFRLRRLLI